MGEASHETCRVPFTSLVLEPGGKVSVCRKKGLFHPVGDLGTETLREIWNGERIREWRRDFLEHTHSICATEMRHRRCHITAQANMDAPDVQFSEYQEYPPTRIGLNLNGRCNLMCPMCDVWKQENDFYEQPHIWKQLEEIFPQVKYIEMFGGEPFFQRYTFRVMRTIAKVNPSCSWNITTNATWKFNDYIKEHLDPLVFRKIIISADSLIPEVFAKIRFPGRLETFLATVDALSEYDYERRREGRPGIFFSTNSTLQRDNWRELPELLRFGLEHGNIEPNVAFLYYPNDLSLISLPLEERAEVLRYWAQHVNRSDFHKTDRLIKPILESMPPFERASVLSDMAEVRRPTAGTSVAQLSV